MVELERCLVEATRLARAAGAVAMAHYGRAARTDKADASPVTEADRASNHVILEGLRRAFPADAVLSEEAADSEGRLGAARVWIVDPLDGTKEFLAQNGEFSVMIGLAEGGAPVLGVVYLPDGDVLYAAARGLGAWVERGGRRRPLRRAPVDGRPLRMVQSRSHGDPLTAAVQRALGVTDILPCGSVGVKCARIAEGDRDLYVHPVAYMKEWDTCAPEVVLREAGGSVTDCRGEALRYNKRDPVQPHGIIACAPGALPRVLERVLPLLSATAIGTGTRA